MKTISINGVDFAIPTSYNELNVQQVKAIGRMIAENTPENQLKTLYALLGLRFWNLSDRRKWKVVLGLSAEWLHTLLTHENIFAWLYDKAQLVKYPISSFWYRGVKYHGPNGDILNTNASEVVFAYKFFKSYSDSHKMEMLDRLVALLYRPYNPFTLITRFSYGYTGDVRMPLNGYLFNKRVKHFAKLDPSIKSVIFLQWAGAWDVFQNRESNKLLFPKVMEDSSRKEDPYVWEKIMMRMAETGVFGNYNEVERMDKDRFFMNMARNIEEYLAIKDARKK